MNSHSLQLKALPVNEKFAIRAMRAFLSANQIKMGVFDEDDLLDDYRIYTPEDRKKNIDSFRILSSKDNDEIINDINRIFISVEDDSNRSIRMTMGNFLYHILKSEAKGSFEGGEILQALPSNIQENQLANLTTEELHVIYLALHYAKNNLNKPLQGGSFSGVKLVESFFRSIGLNLVGTKESYTVKKTRDGVVHIYVKQELNAKSSSAQPVLLCHSEFTLTRTEAGGYLLEAVRKSNFSYRSEDLPFFLQKANNFLSELEQSKSKIKDNPKLFYIVLFLIDDNLRKRFIEWCLTLSAKKRAKIEFIIGEVCLDEFAQKFNMELQKAQVFIPKKIEIIEEILSDYNLRKQYIEKCVILDLEEQEKISNFINKNLHHDKKENFFEELARKRSIFKDTLDQVYDVFNENGVKRSFAQYLLGFPDPLPDPATTTSKILRFVVSILAFIALPVTLVIKLIKVSEAICKFVEIFFDRNKIPYLSPVLSSVAGILSSTIRAIVSFNPIQTAKEFTAETARPARWLRDTDIGARLGFVIGVALSVAGILGSIILAPLAILPMLSYIAGPAVSTVVTSTLASVNTSVNTISRISMASDVVANMIKKTREPTTTAKLYKNGMKPKNSKEQQPEPLFSRFASSSPEGLIRAPRKRTPGKKEIGSPSVSKQNTSSLK
jgi:hypothetical protein